MRTLTILDHPKDAAMGTIREFDQQPRFKPPSSFLKGPALSISTTVGGEVLAFTMGLLLIAVSGCSNSEAKNAEALTSVNAEPARRLKEPEKRVADSDQVEVRHYPTLVPEKPAKELVFSPDSLKETERWVTQVLWDVQDARSASNQIRLNEARKATEENLQALVGTEVHWELVVGSVSEEYVTFSPGQLVGPVALAFPVADNPGQEDRSRRFRSDQLVVGPHITRDRAATLGSGDSILVHGRIGSTCVADLPHAHVRFDLIDVSVTITPNRKYLAAQGREPFHLPSCEWTRKISQGSRQVFRSREGAIAAGHRPCETCVP